MALSPRRGKRATGTLLYRGYSATPRPVSRRLRSPSDRLPAARHNGISPPQHRSWLASRRPSVQFVVSFSAHRRRIRWFCCVQRRRRLRAQCECFILLLLFLIRDYLVSILSVLPSKKFSVPNQVWFLVRLQKFTRIYYKYTRVCVFLLSKIVVIVGTKPNRGDIK